jgi:hypothetical protein
MDTVTQMLKHVLGFFGVTTFLKRILSGTYLRAQAVRTPAMPPTGLKILVMLPVGSGILSFVMGMMFNFKDDEKVK